MRGQGQKGFGGIPKEGIKWWLKIYALGQGTYDTAFLEQQSINFKQVVISRSYQILASMLCWGYEHGTYSMRIQFGLRKNHCRKLLVLLSPQTHKKKLILHMHFSKGTNMRISLWIRGMCVTIIGVHFAFSCFPSQSIVGMRRNDGKTPKRKAFNRTSKIWEEFGFSIMTHTCKKQSLRKTHVLKAYLLLSTVPYPWQVIKPRQVCHRWP